MEKLSNILENYLQNIENKILYAKRQYEIITMSIEKAKNKKEKSELIQRKKEIIKEIFRLEKEKKKWKRILKNV